MSKYETALQRIDEAHSEDPRRVPDLESVSATPENISPENTTTVPYELRYAQKMTSYLTILSPDAPELLRLAIRAQHLRRWEIPRDSYPATKIGYHAWRTELQRRQAALAETICLESGYTADEAARVAALVRKADLKAGDPDTQTLEDVACLVFLDDQFEKFEEGLGDEEKMIGILRKTWAKMSAHGREEALKIKIRMSERGKDLVERALQR